MIIYLDLDGVLANIHEKIGFNTSYDETPLEILEKGFYEELEVMRGAKQFVNWCLSFDEVDLFIATKIPSKNSYAATEKIRWVEKHFKSLSNRVFITPDKTKLKGDFLIDDDSRWEKFEGEFISFDPRNPISSWKRAKKKISDFLDNSKEVRIEYGHASGVRLLNSSNTEITKIIVSLEKELQFLSIKPGESVFLFEPEIFESDWVAKVKYLEWADGQIETDFTLMTECEDDDFFTREFIRVGNSTSRLFKIAADNAPEDDDPNYDPVAEYRERKRSLLKKQ